MDIVRSILKDNFDYFMRQIKSETSFRKIHEILTTILDNAEALDTSKAKNLLSNQIPRAYVIIEYQNVRGQIYNDLRDLLIEMINDLLSAKEQNVKTLIRKARLLLDSLAVIAKEVG
ncbi:hypothetical protein DFR87_13000 [Metallosphaera hakonensis JCM 8857 = DSM 7519]|uniref:Uncharacterized protein n=2 Tax=Metallosphaera hakonensis TaxID=79601 RepID=A0A2U9IXD1_9CREN|nr:hypothetical protein DFR87_13000 [Metallosphaera hakonensis JCM 8857 = DSM 7519]